MRGPKIYSQISHKIIAESLALFANGKIQRLSGATIAIFKIFAVTIEIACILIFLAAMIAWASTAAATAATAAAATRSRTAATMLVTIGVAVIIATLALWKHCNNILC